MALVTLKKWTEAPGEKTILFGPRILQKLLNPKITSLTFELEIFNRLVMAKFEISENRENN